MFCPAQVKTRVFQAECFCPIRRSASILNELGAVLSSSSARGREPTEKAASRASLKLFLKGSNEQIKGASSKDVVDLLLITQYFDMLNSIGTRPDTLTVFIDEDGE